MSQPPVELAQPAEPAIQQKTSQTNRYNYNIVGESHYLEALSSLMRNVLPDEKGRQRLEANLKLVAQPHNPHDRNAISVQCQGHVLGHIARSRTIGFHRRYRDKLIMSLEVDGLIVGRTGKWRVKLDLGSIR